MSLLGPNLDSFLAVMRTGSVTHAARELNLGQTGVTERIRVLEADLGVSLFIRSRRGMQPTEAGQALLRYCESVRSQEGELMAHLKGAGKNRLQRVTITGPTSVLQGRVTQGLIPVLKSFPSLRITLEFSDTVSGMEKLRQGVAHFAIVRRDEVTKEVDSRLLRPEKYLLVCPSLWKGRALKEILDSEPIIDFDSTDSMTFDYLRKFDLLSLWRGERHYANNSLVLAHLVVAGLGFSVLSQTLAEPFFANNSLVCLNGKRVYDYEVALAWYPRKEMPEWFAAIVRNLK